MKKYKSEFIPEFKKNYLSPVYWSTWFLLGMIAGISMFPPSFRDPVLAKIGRWAGRLSKKARRRATINLSLCFPEKSDTEREIIVDKMFATALQSIVMMAELAIRGPEKFQKRVFWKGLEILEEIRHNNRNVIFLVPHGWSVDIPAMLLAAQGKKMAAMFHQQRNPVIDYVWNSVRRKFGGRLHAREDGIKPFIQSVRQGYWGYYLPDQDHGPEYSEFADFFATLNLQSKCNKKRSTHQLEYNFVSTQKPFPNDEYFLPTSYNKRARKDNDFTRTGQKTSRNCQSTGT